MQHVHKTTDDTLSALLPAIDGIDAYNANNVMHDYGLC